MTESLQQNGSRMQEVLDSGISEGTSSVEASLLEQLQGDAAAAIMPEAQAVDAEAGGAEEDAAPLTLPAGGGDDDGDDDVDATSAALASVCPLLLCIALHDPRVTKRARAQTHVR